MAAPRRLPFITTLHGTDITLVGNNPNFLPITRYSIEQSDGVTFDFALLASTDGLWSLGSSGRSK